jgi:hypothetical protein
MNKDHVAVDRAAVLSALDYLQYLDDRMDTIEAACSEMCRQINKLQLWLERLK